MTRDSRRIILHWGSTPFPISNLFDPFCSVGLPDEFGSFEVYEQELRRMCSVVDLSRCLVPSPGEWASARQCQSSIYRPGFRHIWLPWFVKTLWNCVCVLTHEKDPIVSVAYASYPPTFLSIPIDFLTEATQSTQWCGVVRKAAVCWWPWVQGTTNALNEISELVVILLVLQDTTVS